MTMDGVSESLSMPEWTGIFKGLSNYFLVSLINIFNIVIHFCQLIFLFLSGK